MAQMRQVSVTVTPERYQDAAIILMRGEYPIGQIVVLDVYEVNGQIRVRLGLTLPDDTYAARASDAGVGADFLAEREREYVEDVARNAHAHHHGNGNGNGAPSASGSYRDLRDLRDPRAARAAQSAQSSARWRKPSKRDGLPNHNGRRW